MGGSSFLINVVGRAFVSFAEARQSLISIGDPVDAEGSGRQLIWDLRELADRTTPLCASCAVTPKYVRTYLGMGLPALGFGEGARVGPTGFKLAVPSFKDLRRARAHREAQVFHQTPRNGVPVTLPRFRRVSDVWLRIATQSVKQSR